MLGTEAAKGPNKSITSLYTRHPALKALCILGSLGLKGIFRFACTSKWTCKEVNALIRDDKAMLKMLLSEIFEHSGSPSARAHSKIIHASLLLDCARTGKYELVRLLLSPEFDPKQASIDEALMKAVQNGHYDGPWYSFRKATIVARLAEINL
jgi:hypothetical protein